MKKNGLNPNLGNIAYSGKFSRLGEKKYLIRQKKKTLSKIVAPGPTSSVGGQLFMRSLNHPI